MPVYKYNGRGRIIKGKTAKGIWKYNFQIDRKRYKGSIKGVDTKREAEAYEAEMITAVRNGTYGKPSQSICFEDFVRDHYLTWAKHHTRSYEWYVMITNALCDYFKGTPLREITTSDIEHYLTMRRDGKTIRGTQRSGASVNRERALLSGVFTRAIKLGYAQMNPCKGVDRFEEFGRRERVVTSEEKAKLLAALIGKDEDLRPIVEIAWETGMRRTELMRFRWEDLDFRRGENGYILLPATVTKNGKARRIPMTTEARAILLELKGAKTEGRIFPMNEKVVGRRIAEICDALGMPDVSLHVIRHTFATRWIAAGGHPFVLKEVMGHSTLSQTNYYTHIGFTEMDREIEKLGRREI